MSSEENGRDSSGARTEVGASAIKWSAIVIIVGAVLYFLAQYVMPLFG